MRRLTRKVRAPLHRIGSASASMPMVVAVTMLFASLPVAAHAPSESAKQLMLEGGYLDSMWIGAEHMLTGYDHLLFLLGVLFFLKRPIDIVKFVTAFTVGHTITLLGGTLAGIRVDPFVIDAIIALTVIYKAVENLDGFSRWWGFRPPSLLRMVFVFGLIHGFGLATRLQELTLARDSQLVGKILSFNVGVELAQVGALIVMGAVLSVWRSVAGWHRFTLICNWSLVLAGVLLFALQVHDYFSRPAVSDFAARAMPSETQLLQRPRS